MTMKKGKAFTLVEILITVLVASVVLLSILAGLVYSLHAQKMARERTMAQREATILIEEARRLAFPFLVPVENREVLIDDNRTPDDDSDDLNGTASLKLYRLSDNTELASAQGETMILVQAVVTWNSMGRDHELTVISHFAP
jgi:type II secretory pathway pseudopilin PulG